MSIDAVFPPLLDHASVADCPRLIVGGVAAKDDIDAGAQTLTVTVFTAVPQIPVTVNVYVVVFVGETVLDPDVETAPIP